MPPPPHPPPPSAPRSVSGSARPVYLLSPSGADALVSGLLPGQKMIVVAEVEELRDRTPGLLLLPIDVLPPEQVVAALAHAAAGSVETPWMPVFVERSSDGGEPRMMPVSLGWPTAAAELERWAGGAADAEVLELRHVLTRVARGRHDLNNPLTSAMAETQLALMDTSDPSLRAGLETIEEQLRRIRDLVAGLRVLRPPDGRRS